MLLLYCLQAGSCFSNKSSNDEPFTSVPCLALVEAETHFCDLQPFWNKFVTRCQNQSLALLQTSDFGSLTCIFLLGLLICFVLFGFKINWFLVCRNRIQHVFYLFLSKISWNCFMLLLTSTTRKELNKDIVVKQKKRKRKNKSLAVGLGPVCQHEWTLVKVLLL